MRVDETCGKGADHIMSEPWQTTVFGPYFVPLEHNVVDCERVKGVLQSVYSSDVVWLTAIHIPAFKLELGRLWLVKANVPERMQSENEAWMGHRALCFDSAGFRFVLGKLWKSVGGGEHVLHFPYLIFPSWDWRNTRT
ncbi:unnamed protein product [Ostreobium quekettii]|uniref:Uncharacterized protein n=1 Tax=Ostreobium quekettii TaxID=121088 RepID=A0A8S1J8F2_9CHLO|nr:unnamed protein product [Ostreobium quekettii]